MEEKASTQQQIPDGRAEREDSAGVGAGTFGDRNFLDLFVVHADDEPARNCVASALLLAFPDPWEEQQYTHARARMVPILEELRARAETARGKTLDMYGRVTDEQLLALMNTVDRTRFAQARGNEARKALFKSIVEVLAYDPRQADEHACIAVVRALRIEMEQLHANPAAAGLPPESMDPWELAVWFGNQHERYGDTATTAWRNKVAVTLREALANPAALPGSVWEDDEPDDSEVAIHTIPERHGPNEDPGPAFYWSLPPPSNKLEVDRTQGAEERIVTACSTYTPLSAFTTGSTTWLFDSEIKFEIDRLLKLADTAEGKSDLAGKENALARLMILATGTSASVLPDLRWAAADTTESSGLRYPGALSLDARWLLRPELDPADVKRASRGAIHIPLPRSIQDRLRKLRPEPGKRVFANLAWRNGSERSGSNKPTLASLAMALPGRLMRSEPWGISLAQLVAGDLRGLDPAPLFYDQIGVADAAMEVAKVTFPWFDEKPGGVGVLPSRGGLGSRRVPELAPVRRAMQAIRADHALAQGNFPLQLRHRMRNAVHGFAIQSGLRINGRMEDVGRGSLSLEDPLAMACDKVVAPDWMLRPVALGKRWQEEIRRLLMDLVWASKQYKDRPLGKAAAAALDGSGSLFLDVLGEDDVRPFGVTAYQEGVPTELDGLDNFARQLLNNRLTRRLPEVLRVAQLGWHGTREGAWADGSPWSVLSAARAISPKLDEVLAEIGWRPLPVVVEQPIPEMPLTCWARAFKDHQHNNREMLGRAKQKFDERNSRIVEAQIPMLRGFLSYVFPELALDEEGGLVHGDPNRTQPVEIGPEVVAKLRRRLAPGDARSRESIVAQNLLHDLIRDARRRGVVAGPLPRRVHARWPRRPGPFVAESAVALEQARRLDAAVIGSGLPLAAKTFIGVLLHGGYADADVVLAAMARGARLSRLESEPGVLLLDPPVLEAEGNDQWQRGCLAFNGLAALHLGSWHCGEKVAPMQVELENMLRALPPGTLPLKFSEESSPIAEIESLAKACNAVRMDGIARLVGTCEVQMTCAGLERIVAARDGLLAAPASIRPEQRHAMRRQEKEMQGHRIHGLLDRIFNVVTSACAESDAGKIPESEIRDALAGKLRSWIHPDRPPRAAELVALYVLLLLERGGRRKAHLALTTIRGYMYEVGQLLTRFMPSEPMSASADEWQAAYVEIVAGSEEDSIACSRVAALANFHWVLAQEYEVPDVDFSILYEMVEIPPDLADAGFLTTSERRALDSALDADTASAEDFGETEDVRLAKARRLGSLLVGEGAMRPGEAARMRHADFQAAPAVAGAYVRKSGIQKLKTVAARRRLKATGTLQRTVDEQLEAWRLSEQARHRAGFQSTMPLFGIADYPEVPMEDSVLFQRTGMLVRAITRTPNARTYWLRKTAARDRLEALMSVEPGSLWPMRDMIAHFGHGAIRVTLRSYTHDPVTPFLRWFTEHWIRIDARRIALAWRKSISRVARTRGGKRLDSKPGGADGRVESLVQSLPLFRPSGPGHVKPIEEAIPAVKPASWRGLYGILEQVAGGASVDSAVRAHHWPVAMVWRLSKSLDELQKEHGVVIGPREDSARDVMMVPSPRRVEHDVIDALIAAEAPSPVLGAMAKAWLSGMTLAVIEGVPASTRVWGEWVDQLPLLESMAWRSTAQGRRALLWYPESSRAGATGPWPRWRLLMLAAWIHVRLSEMESGV